MSKSKVQGQTPAITNQNESSNGSQPEIHLNNPNIFFDRELSWIDFNRRVLEEANDPENPLLERLKFLSITETNLDEFYMVRVAGLRNLVKEGNDERSLNGDSASEILSDLSDKVRVFVREEYETFARTLEELKVAGIHLILNPEELTIEEIKQIQNYYQEDVSPILTPLAIDTAHPFPHILNKSLNLAMVLSTDDEKPEEKRFVRCRTSAFCTSKIFATQRKRRRKKIFSIGRNHQTARRRSFLRNDRKRNLSV